MRFDKLCGTVNILLVQQVMNTHIRSDSHRFLLGSISLALIAFSQGALAAQPRYAVTDLGTLPGGGLVGASAINNSGQVVGVARNSNSLSRPFLYEAGAMRDLGAGTNNGYAANINNAGQVIGNFSTPYDLVTRGRDHSFLYSGGQVIDLSLQFGRFVALQGINDAGTIAGFGEDDNGDIKAALIAGGTLNFINIPFLVSVNDINNRGHLLGTLSFPGETPQEPVYRAAIIKGTRLVDFALAGSYSTHGVALNDDGEAVGHAWLPGGGAHGFLYSRGRTVDVGTLPGDPSSFLWDINNEGVAVGMSVPDDEVARAVVYQHGVLKNLNDMISPESGWYLITAQGINDSGQIVGRAFVGEDVRGFLLTPIRGKGREK